MVITKSDLESFNRVHRLNVVNSISGVKQVCLIGTKSAKGENNIGVFNSVFHLGSDPALLGFVMRPSKEVRRDTYENIKETGCFTINHVHQSILINSHFTSAKFNVDTSEFEKCNLTPKFYETFEAPHVEESFIRIGLRFIDEMKVSYNETTIIVGQIEWMEFPNSIIEKNGRIDFDKSKNVVVSGLNKYYQINHVMDLPYARVDSIPRF